MASDTKYVARGRFSRGGTPLAGAAVRLLEHDPGKPPTGMEDGMTGEDGSFELTATQRQAGGRGEGLPELSVALLDEEGRTIASTTVMTGSPDAAIEFGELDVDSLRSAAAPSSIGTGRGEVAGSSGATSGTTPQERDPSAAVGQARFHGSTTREVTAPKSTFFMGPFGRMFRKLPAWTPPGATETQKDDNIRAIAATMFEPQGSGGDPAGDNATIPSGYTYFGQFVDHDITFDPTSSLTKRNDPDRLHNFRTPRFDLDNLYGEGPDDEPFMYERGDPGKLLVGAGKGENERDLPRNSQDVALIGDKRNDENTIVSQLQLAFIKLHNEVLDRVRSAEGLTGKEAFSRAQEVVRFHYQHVVLFDFLPRICGQDLVRSLIDFDNPDPGNIKVRFYKPKDSPYMPVEFSVAAYRVGHSMIRGRYDLNSIVTARPIFTPDPNAGELEDLRGFRRLPAFWTLDWARFLELRDGAQVQPSRRVDTRMAEALRLIHPGAASLAELNLLRGFKLGLPSGQAVARAMRETPLTNGELGLDPGLAGHEAPLWYYILKEAELGGGEHLGRVGGRIVAEVFLGLAKADPTSFLNLDPSWTPATAIAGAPLIDTGGAPLQLRDLIRAAALDADPFPPAAPPPPAAW